MCSDETYVYIYNFIDFLAYGVLLFVLYSIHTRFLPSFFFVFLLVFCLASAVQRICVHIPLISIDVWKVARHLVAGYQQRKNISPATNLHTHHIRIATLVISDEEGIVTRRLGMHSQFPCRFFDFRQPVSKCYCIYLRVILVILINELADVRTAYNVALHVIAE